MHWQKIDTLPGPALGPSLVVGPHNLVGIRDDGYVYLLEQGATKHKRLKLLDSESAAEAVVDPPYIYWGTEAKGKLWRQGPDLKTFKEIHPGYKGGGWSLGMARSPEGRVLNTVNHGGVCTVRRIQEDDAFAVRDYKDLSMFGLTWAGDLGWFGWGYKGKSLNTGHAYAWLLDQHSLEIKGTYSLGSGYAWRGAWVRIPGWVGLGRLVIGTRPEAKLYGLTDGGFQEIRAPWKDATRIDRIVEYPASWYLYGLDNGELWESDAFLSPDGWALIHSWPGYEIRAMGPRADGQSLLVYVNKPGKRQKSECWEGR